MAVLAWLPWLAGCAANPPPVPPGPDPALAQPAYWMKQPATGTIVHDDFRQLWRACRHAAQDSSFNIDRLDWRSGVILTYPLVTKQPFQFWRADTVSIEGLAEAALSTVRRTVRFDIRRLPDGRYEAVPKVLVERFAVAERRITSVAQYGQIFAAPRAEGDRERDRGVPIPDGYWFAVGRDQPLERRLADMVRDRVWVQETFQGREAEGPGAEGEEE